MSERSSEASFASYSSEYPLRETENPMRETPQEGEDVKPDVHVWSALSNERSVIYDGINVEFRPKIFVKQFLLQMFPYLFLPFQSCFEENFEAMGLWQKPDSQPKRILLVFAYMVPAFTGIMLLCAYLMPCKKQTELMSGNWLLALIFVVLHRVCVALKYATLNESEYRRMTSSDFYKGLSYNYQMQVLSSWNGGRQNVLWLYLSAAAECLADIDLNDLKISIRPPAESVESKFQFVQWQNFMMDAVRDDIKIDPTKIDPTKFTSDEVHEKLKDVIIKHRDGESYYIHARDVLFSIIRHVDYVRKEGSWVYRYLNRYVTLLCISIPIIRMSYKCITIYKSLSAWEWVLLVVEMTTSSCLIYIFCNADLDFFTVLLNDSYRRQCEAVLLKDMIRCSEVLTEHESIMLARNPASKRGMESYSTIYVDKDESVDSHKAPRMISYADIIVEKELYKAATASEIEAWKGRNRELLDSAEKKGMSEKEIDDMIGVDSLHDTANPGRFLGRIPSIDLKVNSISNLTAWLGIRDVLRSVGLRIKFRLDSFSIFLTVTTVALFLALVAANIFGGDPGSDNVCEVHDHNAHPPHLHFPISLDSSFALQVLSLSISVIVSLLANIAAAVKTNEKYESHKQILLNRYMFVEMENQYKLMGLNKENGADDHIPEAERTVVAGAGAGPGAGPGNTISDSQQAHGEVSGATEKAFLDSLTSSIASISITDRFKPVTVLGIPATWALYLSIISILASIAVMLVKAVSDARAIA